MNRHWVSPTAVAAALAAILAALAGCGRPAGAEPTAIPASVVRPVQSTPQYPGGADVFSLLTPGITPQFVPTAAAEDALAVASASSSQARAAIKLYIENQTPSAVGIAPSGTAIYAERGGRTLAAVPVGGVLTVTGKSADEAWYSVYNDDAVFGWTPAGQLRVYGDDDLVVVAAAPDPAPVATLLAQAAVPVHVLDDLMARFDAAAVEVAGQPMAAALASPTPEPAATMAPDAAPGAGVVTSNGRLNVRTAPDTAAAIIRKLDPGAVVSIVDRSADNTWLRLSFEDGATGWVAAEYIRSTSP